MDDCWPSAFTHSETLTEAWKLKTAKRESFVEGRKARQMSGLELDLFPSSPSVHRKF